jgi:hypothetical protein
VQREGHVPVHVQVIRQSGDLVQKGDAGSGVEKQLDHRNAQVDLLDELPL